MPSQMLLSLQNALFGVFTQRSCCGLQTSVVQPMPSPQVGGGPAWQPFGPQISAPLQNTPSLHCWLLPTCLHWLAASSQLSTVQELLSLQFGGLPGTHPSSGSQRSVPSQKRPLLQSEFLRSCLQLLVASSQVSTVQGTWSLQLGGEPGWQPWCGSQNSSPLQIWPSSQLPSFGMSTHPMASASGLSGSQMPSLQGMPPGSHCCAVAKQSALFEQVNSATAGPAQESVKI